MFFTRAGQIVAWLAFIFGVSLALMGLSLRLNGDEALIVQTLGRRTTGSTIDKGVYLAVFGIVVGILTDISRSVAGQDR